MMYTERVNTATLPKSNVPLYWPLKVESCKLVEADPVEVTVGMEATLCVGSDRYPYEVIEVRDPRTVLVRQMSSQIVKPDGLGNGSRVYLPNPDGTLEFVRLVARRGRRFWGMAKPGDGPRSWVVDDYRRLSFGKADEYRDPSF